MKKQISLLLAFILIFSFPVLAFAEESQVVLNVYNWGEYINLDAIEMFEEEHPDIKVNYTTYDSNESMYSKIVSGAASYDIVIPSDYMISKLISEDMLVELDLNNIPNFSYIDDAFKNKSYDPGNKYSVPYFWGTVVVIYNSKYVDPVDYEQESLDLLWNEKYKGKILMFDNPRDAFGLALTKLGYSLNSQNENEWSEASELLKEQKSLVQAYVMDAIFDKMESNEAWIAPYYAGDALVIRETNPDVNFYLPKEGTNLFFDAMCVLKTTTHKKEAEEFINFMCDPEISAMNSDEVGYATPISKAKEYLDPEITNDPIIYPDDKFLNENTEVFVNLPQKIQMVESSLWTSLKIQSSESGEKESALTWVDWFSIITLSLLIMASLYILVRNARRKRIRKLKL